VEYTERKPPHSGALLGLLDFLAFTGLWPAAVAAGLIAACGWVLADTPPTGRLAAAVALGASGTLVVYNIDRLRDLENDRLTAPRRSRFVAQHRDALTALSVASAGLCLPLVAMLPQAVAWVCASALGLGLFHRRLKGANPAFAVLYITLAWVAVVVGIPAAAVAPGLGNPESVALVKGGAIAAIAVAPSIAANLIASQLRGQPVVETTRRRLRMAGIIALVGCLGPLADSASRPLIAIPLAVWASVMGFRNSERYGLLALDGALLLGALSAIALRLGAWV
jgi:hypothetical protein